MADYDIFREQLGITFPMYGHALWDPRPRSSDMPVKIGDVGFIREGKFRRLFNALLGEDEPCGVPQGSEKLVPPSPDHIVQRPFDSGHYCSSGVRAVRELPQFHDPNSPPQVSFTHPAGRSGAALSLPVNARREDTDARKAFGKWIVKHIDRCFAFAQELELGVEQMEDIILVTGCTHAKSWTNIAFLKGEVDAEASFGVEVTHGLYNNVRIGFSSGFVMGAVLSHGPEGTDLPEDQCIFIRGFRVARPLGIFPRRLRAAAGPSTDRYDHERDKELLSIPSTTNSRDLLHLLLDYVIERAYDCDMVLIHDDDLKGISGIGEGTSLQPEAVMDFFRMSHMEVHKVRCDLSPATNNLNTEAGVVWVATLSNLFQGGDTVPLSQLVTHGSKDPVLYRNISESPATFQASPTLSEGSLLGLPSIRHGISNYQGSSMSRSMLPTPPPADRDVIMGPPPVPPHQLFSPSLQNSNGPTNLRDKYYKLKMKYWEFEEKYKEIEDELKRSGEQITNWSTGKGMLLDRMLELEAAVARQHSSPFPHSPNTQLPSQILTTYPRALQSAHAHSPFQANIREALDEVETEDPALFSSRYMGPQARKRQLEEIRDREEEDNDARKARRRGKAATTPNASKAKDAGVSPSFPPQGNFDGSPPTIPGSSHTLITSSGKRIRIEPTSAGRTMHQIPQFVNNPGVPPAIHRSSPGSPMSPLGSDAEKYGANDGDASVALRNDNRNSNVDTPNQMDPGSSSSAPIPSPRHTSRKPKRSKSHTLTSKNYSIPVVPRDKNGQVILPLNVGIITVTCLGEVCMREHFHTERYIFPVGYSVNRPYLSACDPNAETVYSCTILDGGDAPKFQIIANDMADKPFVASTSSGVWFMVIRAADRIRNKLQSHSVSGPEFFGLGKNVIKHLIQELPGADQLKGYVWQNFSEGGPLGGRHAMVVPDLPDEYDSANRSDDGNERRESHDLTSMDLTPYGELPISDMWEEPSPRRPYGRSFCDPRDSNEGSLDDGSTGEVASIMNAYPEPPYASQTSPHSESGEDHAIGTTGTRGSGSGSAGSTER